MIQINKAKLWVALNLAVILMLIIASIIMMRLTFQIKTEGGKCTANPKSYMEFKLKEQTGDVYKCECTHQLYPLSDIIPP